MDGYMSTAEAAKALGVNRQRVVALIKSGKLEAEKVGRSYVVSAESVEKRKSEKPKPGNPNIKRGYSPRWGDREVGEDTSESLR